jgi:predicted RNase H-like HicB family nuclease
MSKTVEKRISIQVITHRETGLLVAFSPEMDGLYVHGRTEQELRERVPVAIRALLEASGERVIDVSEMNDDSVPVSFQPISRTFGAKLAA